MAPDSLNSLDTRRRILDAAVAAFASVGFRASSINSIAYSASVNEVTVYRHFPKKRELFWEAVDHKMRNCNLVESLLASIAEAGGPRELIEYLVTSTIQEFDHDPTLARLLSFTALELESEKHSLFNGYLHPFMQALVARFEDWIESGVVREVDAHSVGVAVIGLVISHYTLHSLFGFGNRVASTPQQFAARYADICLSGISPTALPSQ